MPALNVSFTDEQHALIRAAAEREGVSLKAFTANAAVEAASDRTHLREQLLDDIFAKSSELNRRLA